MRKMLVVAVREYLAAVRTKAFVVSLVIMPVLMGGSLLVQWLLRDYRDVQDKHYAVIDRTPGGRIAPLIEQIVAEYNELQTRDPATNRQVKPFFRIERIEPSAEDPEAMAAQRAEVSERVRKGELFGFLDIGPEALQPATPEAAARERHTVRYQSNRPTNKDLPSLLQAALVPRIQELRYHEERLGVPLTQVRAMMQPVMVKSQGLTSRDPANGAVKDDTEEKSLAAVLVPIGLMMLMFMVIMMSATPQMQGVVEEKMQRVAEVLLASVRPFPLMMGKLLGMSGVSLTITAVYLSGTYWAARHYNFADNVSASLLVWFLVFQALAALMYGSLFIAIGAACTDMKETQNLLWPVMLLVVLPMFLMGSVLQEPNSAVATGVSFFPFATPTLMILRMSVSPGVPAWQPVLGVVVVLLTTLACVWAAGRIFRVGILMQGKGAHLGDMLRWVWSG